MSLLAATAVMLVPVKIDSVELDARGTFVSQQARMAIAEKSVEILHCLNIGKRRNDIDRVCLTQPEWQAVFDRAVEDRGIQQRERAIALGHWNASRPSFTP